MLLFDVNVLIYAVEQRSPDHAKYREWLSQVLQHQEPFGVSELVLSGFLRICTNPRIFNTPWDVPRALDFVSRIRGAPNCVVVRPGPRHWELFVELCRRVGARGNLVPDAYLAALAIESGSEWVTTDRDYARFPELRWRHPLDDPH